MHKEKREKEKEEIANYFLILCDCDRQREKWYEFNSSKVNKLMFFYTMVYYREFGELPFEEEFRVWNNGISLSSIHEKYKNYRYIDIGNKFFIDETLNYPSEKATRIAKEVWGQLKVLSSDELEIATKDTTLYQDIYHDLSRDDVIKTEELENYLNTQIKKTP